MHLELPGGHSAEIREVDDLTGADQDKYLDFVESVRTARQAGTPAHIPDPENPAAMIEAPRPALTTTDVREIQAAALAMTVTSWDYPDMPLPYVNDYRARLPIYACNALVAAIEPHMDALNGGEGPKPQPTGTGSSSTSPDAT